MVTPSLNRLPTKAEDPYPAMRHSVIHHQTLTWTFQDHGGLLFYLVIAFSQAVFNTEIFLLGELQLVAKGQEDAFILHV